MTLVAIGMLELTWEANKNPKARFDDQVMLALYCAKLNIADGFSGGAKRRANQCLFRFDSDLLFNDLEVYVSATSLNRNTIADSVYLGRIVR